MTPLQPSPACSSRPRSAADIMQTPFITVVMRVRNEAKHIERTLAQLVAQDYDPRQFEIIVVDGQSTDGTPEAPFVAFLTTD
jgi:cellulose synthase/poly-beta-1,6-N-acetylglucosamine synthase-like glycosyltransferase